MHVAFGAALAGGLGLLIAEPAWPVAARVLAEGLALFLCVRGLRWVAVPAVFAAIHGGFGWGMLSEMLRGGRRG